MSKRRSTPAPGRTTSSSRAPFAWPTEAEFTARFQRTFQAAPAGSRGEEHPTTPDEGPLSCTLTAARLSQKAREVNQ